MTEENKEKDAPQEAAEQVRVEENKKAVQPETAQKKEAAEAKESAAKEPAVQTPDTQVEGKAIEKEAKQGEAKAAEAKKGAEKKDGDVKKAAAPKKAAASAQRRVAAKKKEEEKPREPSKNQPLLDRFVQVIKAHFEEEVIEEAFINWHAKEVPTLVIKAPHWFKVAQFLKHNEQLAFDYLSHLSASDHETHMEVYYQFYSYKEKHSLAVKVKIDRDEAQLASVTPIWPGADWPEREAYDLLGIRFTGHPNLTRILLTDDWVGHPLRKDYQPYDEGI